MATEVDGKGKPLRRANIKAVGTVATWSDEDIRQAMKEAEADKLTVTESAPIADKVVKSARSINVVTSI